MARFEVTFSEECRNFVAKLEGYPSGFNLSFGEIVEVERPSEIYSGETEVTPNEYQQILNTSGKKLNEDIVVNPIPQNYGRIIWNGSTMTIV